MITGNSSSRLVKEKNQIFLLKTFQKKREYYFFREYFINKYLSDINDNFVAKIIKIDKKNLEIFYEYYPQDIEIGPEYFFKYIDLIKKIHINTSIENNECSLYAKESLLSINQTFSNIKERLDILNSINSKFIEAHLNKISKFTFQIKQKLKNKKLNTYLKFSHADSGLHNCILNKQGSLLITDLEYSGLDCPIKQCIDYLLHPKNCNFIEMNEIWLDYFINNCIDEKDINHINYFFSLFAIKWSIILLNEFIPKVWEIRVHASPIRKGNRDMILINQLKKSQIYLRAAQQLFDNERPTILFSKSEKIFISKSY